MFLPGSPIEFPTIGSKHRIVLSWTILFVFSRNSDYWQAVVYTAAFFISQ